MISGLLLLLGTGICWCGLAVVIESGSFRQIPAALIQPLSAMLTLVFTGWAVFVWGPKSLFNISCFFWVGSLLAAGACNYFMLNFVQEGMKVGRAGVVWAFTQSSMIFPFLLGIVGFGEPAGLFRFCGFILILCGLICFAYAKKEEGSSWAFFIPTLAAFLLSGTAQCFASLPSYFQTEGITVFRRMILTQCGILIAFGLDPHRKRVPRISMTNIWILAGIFGFLNLIALLLFYRALNLLAVSQCASAGYPTAQGISIALFFLLSSRRKSTGIYSWIALLLLLSGIVILAVSGL